MKNGASIRPPIFYQGLITLGVLISGIVGVAAEETGPPAKAPFGPYPRRNLHPLFLPFYQPTADRAQALKPGSFTLFTLGQYASLQRADQHFGASGEDLGLFDGEFLRWSIFLRYGIWEGLDLSVEIPFHASGPGFLDRLVEGIHDLTGSVRDDRQAFRFDETLRVDGREVLRENSTGFAIADVPLQVKCQLLEESRGGFGLALRGGLELPAGSEARWIGNGGVDGAAGLLLERSFWDFTLYLNFDYRFFTTPARLEVNGLSLRPVPNGVAALEWRVFPQVAFLVQVDGSQSPFIDDDLKTLRHPQVEIAGGIRFRAGERLSGMLGFAEDLVFVTSPDVTFFLGVGMDLGE
ncbi:MAG: DUF3187 family protein [Planctomycetes bacterium]|nr:DUF3187 family protein [Planctomycetota bacterium]